MKKAFFAGFLCLGVLVASVVALGYGRKTRTVSGLETMTSSQINCKSVMLVDYDSDTILYKNNENNRYPIASMTKIMTLLLTFEDMSTGKISLDDRIVISERSAAMGGSQAFLEQGCEYILSELVKTVVVASANDSCIAIAEKLSGSVENFVRRMNERAKELQLSNTNFVNCTGLPAPEQFSSASDVCKMTKKLLQHSVYYDYTKIWTCELLHPTGRVTVLTNTNKLVKFYDGCDSGKTGFTSEAGHCISTSAKRGNLRLIATVIGAENSKDRFALAKQLFDTGFETYENKILVDTQNPLEVQQKVKGGKQECVSVGLLDNLSCLSKRGEKFPEYTLSYELAERLKAPLQKGDVVGVLKAKCGDTVLCSAEIICLENVEVATFKSTLDKVIKKWTL